MWIAEVAGRGWLIITRDRHIRDHQRGIQAVRDHDAKMVTLAGDEAQGTWNQLEVLMCQWRAIEEHHRRSRAVYLPRHTNRAHSARPELSTTGSGGAILRSPYPDRSRRSGSLADNRRSSEQEPVVASGKMVRSGTSFTAWKDLASRFGVPPRRVPRLVSEHSVARSATDRCVRCGEGRVAGSRSDLTTNARQRRYQWRCSICQSEEREETDRAARELEARRRGLIGEVWGPHPGRARLAVEDLSLGEACSLLALSPSRR